MTQLLVSVRDADEASDALAGGADLIDVKEPRHGSLGATPASMVRNVIRLVDNRRPLSVALGELLDIAGVDHGYCAGAEFAKVGLAGCAFEPQWPERWAMWARPTMPRATRFWMLMPSTATDW